jgi:transposase
VITKGITPVAMESPGEEGKPLSTLLAASFTGLVVNAQPIKPVPGRTTDGKDAAWLADLLRHGLLRGSFAQRAAAPLPPRDWRALPRPRTTLVQDRARVGHPLQNVLEWATRNVGSLVTDRRGVSARALWAAIGGGAVDQPVVAALVQGRLRAKPAALARALAGHVRAHPRLLLARQLSPIDVLEEQIADCDHQLAEDL